MQMDQTNRVRGNEFYVHGSLLVGAVVLIYLPLICLSFSSVRKISSRMRLVSRCLRKLCD